MRERRLNLPLFGVSVLRHPRAQGGPRVWTVLLRVGRKKRLA